MDLKKFEQNSLSHSEASKIKGGVWQVVGGVLIWCLWEVFDDPESFKKGLKDGSDT